MAMSRTRRVLLSVLGLGSVVAVGIVTFAFLPTPTRPIAPVASAPSHDLIEAGRYVATAGDCVACHTTEHGAPFAGGLPMGTPLGTIFATNITPDRETGIGGYSLEDFERVMRHGIRPNGETIYPAMPYPSYARMTDDDIRALYAYFQHAVEPVRQADAPNDIPWPLSMRWPLAIWRKVFVGSDAPVFDASRYPDPQVARGAYLVQGPGHCGTCHTARAITLQEVALDESSADYLGGGQVIDGWFAVNLRGNTGDGLGRWTAEDIENTLRTGRNRDHAVIGTPMSDVVYHSTQDMTEDDLRAIAAYLKTLTPARGNRATYAEDRRTAEALIAGEDLGRGSQIYQDSCTACHRNSGFGQPGAFPVIAGNPTVLADNPTSVIRLILNGSALPSTHQAPSNLGMPNFDWRYSDAEIAELVTFIRRGFGNNASVVDARAVAEVRRVLDAERRHTSPGRRDDRITAAQ